MKRTRRNRAGAKQDGIALILVLGLVIFLTVVALAFSDNQRVSTQIASNTVQIARAQAAASLLNLRTNNLSAKSLFSLRS